MRKFRKHHTKLKFLLAIIAILLYAQVYLAKYFQFEYSSDILIGTLIIGIGVWIWILTIEIKNHRLRKRRTILKFKGTILGVLLLIGLGAEIYFLFNDKDIMVTASKSLPDRYIYAQFNVDETYMIYNEPHRGWIKSRNYYGTYKLDHNKIILDRNHIDSIISSKYLLLSGYNYKRKSAVELLQVDEKDEVLPDALILNVSTDDRNLYNYNWMKNKWERFYRYDG